MARMWQSDADFALTADLGDEDLPLPHDLDRPWVRRLRRPACATAVLVLAGGIVVRVGASGDTPRAAPRPSASPAPHGGVVVAPARVVHLDAGSGAIVSDELDSVCPAGVSCRTTRAVPVAVAAAIRAAFPGSAAPTGRTLTRRVSAGPVLLGRQLHATTDTADITVQVLPGRLARLIDRAGTGGGAIVVVQRVIGADSVRVTVAGPAAAVHRGAAAVRLASDPRLAALG